MEGGGEVLRKQDRKRTISASFMKVLDNINEKCSRISGETVLVKFCHLKIVNCPEIYSPHIQGERSQEPQNLGQGLRV